MNHILTTPQSNKAYQPAPTKRALKAEDVFEDSKLDLRTLKKWAECLPQNRIVNLENPEWKPTPILPLDLSSIGYGKIYIKDESNLESNPTGTMKDRAAWTIAKLYRDFAFHLLQQFKNNELSKNEIRSIPIPRVSLISAGNEGLALARCFEKFELPKPKVVVDCRLPETSLQVLEREYLELYKVDLSQAVLTKEMLKKISRNENGIDLTSVKSFQPNEALYDWHVHEAFNFQPSEIFIPYGSGRLFENYLTWQQKILRDRPSLDCGSYLISSATQVSNISLFASEPALLNSAADKLTSAFKPFKHLNSSDIKDQKAFRMTGKDTQHVQVPEEFILESKRILDSAKIDTEYSGAAGLAAYLFLNRKSPKSDKRVLIINTGYGVLARHSN